MHFPLEKIDVVLAASEAQLGSDRDDPQKILHGSLWELTLTSLASHGQTTMVMVTKLWQNEVCSGNFEIGEFACHKSYRSS